MILLKKPRNDQTKCEQANTLSLRGKLVKATNLSLQNNIDCFIRNLCAKEWVEQYHGTVEEFAAYFSALSTEELEVCLFHKLNFDVRLTLPFHVAF